jgi:glycosyltransferase involved in cell wall biosynthesis
VIEAARRHNVDLVHTSTLVNPEGALAAAWLGLPHVWHVRELIGPEQPYRFIVEGRAFGRMLDALASVVVANSEATAACFRAWLSHKTPLAVVENGIDLARFAPSAARGQRTPPVVAMVGSVTTRWKKHALFIDALGALPRDLAVGARIYGRLPGDDDEYLQGLRARAQAAGVNVQWMGFVDDPAVIMRDVDILLHPADGESFGRIAVEAMAAHIPVVGVRGGGIGAVVADEVTGLLADNDDAAGLARQLERVVRDVPLRLRLGDAGRARAEARFSLQAHAARMSEVYDTAWTRPLHVLPESMRSRMTTS